MAKEETKADYVSFMQGLVQLHGEGDPRHCQCVDCMDTGYKAEFCCGGWECACQGGPVDFVECECGALQASEKEILEAKDRWQATKKGSR